MDESTSIRYKIYLLDGIRSWTTTIRRFQFCVLRLDERNTVVSLFSLALMTLYDIKPWGTCEGLTKNIRRFQNCILRLDERNTEIYVFHLTDPCIRYKTLRHMQRFSK